MRLLCPAAPLITPADLGDARPIRASSGIPRARMRSLIWVSALLNAACNSAAQSDCMVSTSYAPYRWRICSAHRRRRARRSIFRALRRVASGAVSGAVPPAPILQLRCRLDSTGRSRHDGRSWHILPEHAIRMMALSTAFPPNACKPSFFVDPAEERRDGLIRAAEAVRAKRDAHSPTRMVPLFLSRSLVFESAKE
jgi:hypothetical protein